MNDWSNEYILAVSWVLSIALFAVFCATLHRVI
jgi:hypothetical protein